MLLLNYFSQPKVAEFEVALSLAQDEEECVRVLAVQEQWTNDELLRIKWFEFYISDEGRDFDEVPHVTARDGTKRHAEFCVGDGERATHRARAVVTLEWALIRHSSQLHPGVLPTHGVPTRGARDLGG